MSTLNEQISRTLREFIAQEKLPESFISLAQEWYLPLAEQLATQKSQVNRPLVLGVNGSQGSGKSTLSALLVSLLDEVHGLNTISLSIDDFYLTRDERLKLSKEVHPLLATRGVPGTHDIGLMMSCIEKLCEGTGAVSVPRFNKAEDDRHKESAWSKIFAPVDVLILEGWCLGVPAQKPSSLEVATNSLEEKEDPNSIWRKYVNQCLENEYQTLHQRIDIWIMLKAPSFEHVYAWRLEQEEKLKARLERDGKTAQHTMTPEQIERFIQHYQRLTEQALNELPGLVHYLFTLDASRQVTEFKRPNEVCVT